MRNVLRVDASLPSLEITVLLLTAVLHYSSRLFNKWYSSGGVGLELAANVAGDDAIDLNFNWYGNLFNRDVLVNAFRNKGNSFDVEAGYSHALLNRSLDLRLKVIGYQFDMGTAVQGWRGGADLTTRDGVLTLRYEHGHDRLNGDYNTVGGFVTVGFQLENLLSFESPFTLPEPVFKSPREVRRLLGLKVKRNWYQPEAVVLARSVANPSPPPPSSLTTTATGSCVGPGSGLTYFLSPQVSVSATASFSTLTVTFAAPAPSGGGAIQIRTDAPAFASLVPVPGGATSVTTTKAANPSWFGTIAGNFYVLMDVNNADALALWCPSPITLVWQ